MLDNSPHIKAYWIMLGIKIAQIALQLRAPTTSTARSSTSASTPAAGAGRRRNGRDHLDASFARPDARPYFATPSTTSNLQSRETHSFVRVSTKPPS